MSNGVERHADLADNTREMDEDQIAEQAAAQKARVLQNRPPAQDPTEPADDGTEEPPPPPPPPADDEKDDGGDADGQ